jgi:hypothetical protein
LLTNDSLNQGGYVHFFDFGVTGCALATLAVRPRALVEVARELAAVRFPAVFLDPGCIFVTMGEAIFVKDWRGAGSETGLRLLHASSTYATIREMFNGCIC